MSSWRWNFRVVHNYADYVVEILYSFRVIVPFEGHSKTGKTGVMARTGWTERTARTGRTEWTGKTVVMARTVWTERTARTGRAGWTVRPVLPAATGRPGHGLGSSRTLQIQCHCQVRRISQSSCKNVF